MVEHTRKVGIDVAFTTNGVLADKLIPVLDSINWIKVSCNAGDPRTYAKIHQTKFSDFTKVWDNLRLLARKRTPKTVIGVQAVLLPDNANSMENLVKLARSTELDYCVIKPYSQHKSSITNEYSSTKYTNYTELVTKLESYSTNTFEVVARKKSMTEWDSGEHTYTKCHATPSFWSYIMSDGAVYSCSAYLLDERFNMGNINTHSFSDIWLGDKRKAHLDYIANELDITNCRMNCRMNHVNQFLADLKGGIAHQSFI
jgi:cyclic pyranopterin phosphate synthase